MALLLKETCFVATFTHPSWGWDDKGWDEGGHGRTTSLPKTHPILLCEKKAKVMGTSFLCRTGGAEFPFHAKKSNSHCPSSCMN